LTVPSLAILIRLVILWGIFMDDDKTAAAFCGKDRWVADFRRRSTENESFDKDNERSGACRFTVTLCGDWRKGRPPSFHCRRRSASGDSFTKNLLPFRAKRRTHQPGHFRSQMDVAWLMSAVNFVLDSKLR
jgi:D-Tyr-tRNAtyr deacylase